MSILAYDPDLWLESLTRALKSFCEARINDPDVSIEMSFPDTANWTKETPLDKAIVHFEIDDIQNPTLGFGEPGVDSRDDIGNGGTIVRLEAVQHLVNFDVGVWVPAQLGGATKRMELVRKVTTMFGSVNGKQDFNTSTEGLWPVSYEGGQNVLDRINDIPLWRAMGMTLVVRAFERVTPDPGTQIEGFGTEPNIVIDDNGTLAPVTTP